MHKSEEQLEAGIEHILAAPKDAGILKMIVSRPQTDQRNCQSTGQLTTELGLIGDNWKARGFSRAPDGSAHLDMQLNIMNSRAIDLIAQSQHDWPLAGDQLYVDMDLSKDNLPPGTRLSVGAAQIEVTAEPHLGCKKFADRFGKAATLFVNSDIGKTNGFRGICAKVIKDGEIGVGDRLTKL